MAYKKEEGRELSQMRRDWRDIPSKCNIRILPGTWFNQKNLSSTAFLRHSVKQIMDWLCIKELLLILWSVVMLLQLCYKAEFLSVSDCLVKLYPVWICFKILQQGEKKSEKKWRWVGGGIEEIRMRECGKYYFLEFFGDNFRFIEKLGYF